MASNSDPVKIASNSNPVKMASNSNPVKMASNSKPVKMASNSDLESLKELVREEKQKLKALCEHLEKINISNAGECPDREALQSKYAMVKAKLEELQSNEFEGIPMNKGLQVALLKQRLVRQVAGLENLSQQLDPLQDKLVKKKEKLLAHLDIEEKLIAFLSSSEGHSPDSALPSDVDEKIKELNEKVKKIKILNNLRVSQMRVVLEHLYPEGEQYTIPEVRKKDTFCSAKNPQKKSYLSFIESLVNASLVKSDPWVPIDSTTPEPFVEFLFRNGLILRHPSNYNLIKLENFHE